MDVTPLVAASPLHRDRAPSGSSIRLPAADGELERIDVLTALPAVPKSAGTSRSREYFAAPHVIASPLSGGDRAADEVDWEATLSFRDHLWDLGLGVAEAMDTAQRGMGLSWPLAKDLITATAERATARSARLVCGAATDQLNPADPVNLSAVVDAYLEQYEFIAGKGAVPVLMASAALVSVARTPSAYRTVYASVLEQCSGPVILHWLGEVFDPKLKGYWGSDDLDTAIESLVELITAHADRIDGIKVSVLSAKHEISLRNRLPSGVRLYTGDDFNYPELIKGDADGHSDALLGVFNPIASVAAAGLDALDTGNVDLYDQLMNPTVPLARTLFAAPTQSYKSGIVFLSYLNGHQSHFKMLQGDESRRSVLHYAKVFRLADAAGVLRDPAMAVDRMSAFLRLAGIS